MISYKFTGGLMLQARAKQFNDLNSSELLVLLVLGSFAGEDGACWPSQKEIASVSRMSLATTSRVIAALTSKGYIEKHDRHLPNSKAKTTSYYLLTSKVVPDNRVRAKVIPISRTTKEKLTDRSWAEAELF